MKANELMICDWVYEGSNQSLQVKANYGRSIRYEVEGSSHEVEETLLNPIPLTEEILKANGFELYLFEHYIHRYDNNPNHYDFKLTKGGVFSNEGYRMKCGICDITIKYVHELQHALRLCGLNEFANNFKLS